MLATQVFCLNCGDPVPPNRDRYCSDRCGSNYRSRHAYADAKPVNERRRSFYMTPAQEARPDRANLDRVAFFEALDEISDRDVVNEILYTIDVWTGILMQYFKPVQAGNRAAEIVAAFVWESINFPKAGRN